MAHLSQRSPPNNVALVVLCGLSLLLVLALLRRVFFLIFFFFIISGLSGPIPSTNTNTLNSISTRIESPQQNPAAKAGMDFILNVVIYLVFLVSGIGILVK